MVDATALKARLGASDKLRIDQHFEGIRTLERRLAMLEERAWCRRCRRARCRATPATSRDEALAPINQAMADLIAMCLACDQTRVFTNMYSGSVGGTRYSDVGATDGHHDLTHDERGSQPTVDRITTYIVDHFAKMLVALEDIPEGDGNAARQLLPSSRARDMRVGARSHDQGLPILIAGRAGGALTLPGRPLPLDARREHENALLTMLRALGLDLSEFGQGGGRTTQTVSEIET